MGWTHVMTVTLMSLLLMPPHTNAVNWPSTIVAAELDFAADGVTLQNIIASGFNVFIVPGFTFASTYTTAGFTYNTPKSIVALAAALSQKGFIVLAGLENPTPSYMTPNIAAALAAWE